MAKHKRDLSLSPPSSEVTTPQTDLASNQQSISRIAGAVWKALPESERTLWFERAKAEKSAHAQRFPGYQFAPISATAMYDTTEGDAGGVGPIRRKRVVRKGRKEEQLKAEAQICQDVADAIVRRRLRTHERATQSPSSAGEEPKTPELENGSRVISVSPPSTMGPEVVEGNHPPTRAPPVPSSPLERVASAPHHAQASIVSTPTPVVPTSTFSRQSSFASFASRPVTYGFSPNAPSAPVEPLFKSPEVNVAARPMATTPSGWVSGRMTANSIRPVLGDDRWSIRPSPTNHTDHSRRSLLNLDNDDDDD